MSFSIYLLGVFGDVELSWEGVDMLCFKIRLPHQLFIGISGIVRSKDLNNDGNKEKLNHLAESNNERKNKKVIRFPPSLSIAPFQIPLVSISP